MSTQNACINCLNLRACTSCLRANYVHTYTLIIVYLYSGIIGDSRPRQARALPG